MRWILSKTKGENLTKTALVVSAALVSTLALSGSGATSAWASPVSSGDQFYLAAGDNSNKDFSEHSYNPSMSELTAATDDLNKRASAFAEVDQNGSEVFVSKIRQLNYETRSNLTIQWDEAKTYTDGNSYILSIPLTGTDLPEISRIAFQVHAGHNRVNVMEYAARYLDKDHAQLQTWANGVPEKQITATRPAKLGGGDSTTRINWGRVNDCLASKGIAWGAIALLAGACGVACALTAGAACFACVGAVLGAPSGVWVNCLTGAW